jgi:predicted nucleic acid-binding protein
MPNYIVDTSVVADVLVSGIYTIQAERLMLLVDSTTKLLVPGFCLVECTNVLWKRVRSHDISQEEAETLADDLMTLPLSIASVDTLFKRALQIGLAHQLAIYYSIYIALAEKYQHPLVTADARQETAAKAVGVTIKPITDF